ncbi:Aste57867_8872 [Aphanomyces stellatus]|uniref:Aste57867_8872 protein n=1 Tax=Aphanomyces stellatus TaxID=120398 RepID=A0A485KLK3_9STRA|nr:hypothetical protein As57867_008837 [Aphanomyces stellatus]VFT85758.1 Aste57867_8872 [Aphanomyces stellatus]
MSSTTADAVRAGARQRMRKFRAIMRSEKEALKMQIRQLEDTLRHMHKPNSASVLRHDDNSSMAALHARVATQTNLIRLLQEWVTSQQPQPGLPGRSTWLQATLLADPTARRHGFHWLSEKVYHTALHALPQHPFGSHVVDAMQLTIHKHEDDEIESIPALEVHMQFTVFGSLVQVAATIWHILMGSNTEVVEVVQNHLVYALTWTPSTGVSTRTLYCMFQSPDRIVLTYVMVAADECFPMALHELRSHGYGWTVLERVTNSITLVRSANMQFSPLTAHGTDATLPPTASMRDKIGLREAYIQQIQGRMAQSQAYITQSFQ